MVRNFDLFRVFSAASLRCSLHAILVLLTASTIYAAVVKSPDVKSPIAAALRNPGVFEEPLVITRATSHGEDLALSHAIAAYKTQTIPDDFEVFDRFLTKYPQSGWRVALLTNLGLAYYHYGYFSKAIKSWEVAWKVGRSASGKEAKSLVDRAVGELARMHARLGHTDRIAELITEIGDRPLSGAATEAVTGAKEGLWTMRHQPGVAFLCGPKALENLLLVKEVKRERLRFLEEYESGPNGVSLAEVGHLAQKADLRHALVFRDSAQTIPMPAIVHWKVSHFAVLLSEANGRVHVKDPTFGLDLWITRKALDAESSGYFLLPTETLPKGFRQVTLAEAEQVRGMGFVGTIDAGQTQQTNTTTLPTYSCGGMCKYNIIEPAISLSLKDTPVGYDPPKGPSAKVSITYSQREAGQPANFSFFNVSPKWTINWLTYIQDDPALPGANVTRYVAGGGFEAYHGYNTAFGSFARETDTKSGAKLIRFSDSPITYRRLLPDGSQEVYAQSDQATSFPRRIFLTQKIDPQGNVLALNYDGQKRLFSLTDATGRETTFAYESSNSLLITKITDPFGRSAKLGYDINGRLIQITDVLGIISSFTYDSSGLVNSLTTPYGTTKFTFGASTVAGISRFLEITDPLGASERVEFLQGAPGIPYSESPTPVGIRVFSCCTGFPHGAFLDGRNVFYWDKSVLPVARGDYTKARIHHFLHDTVSNYASVSGVMESIKYPLERRIWFNYHGQPDGGGTGDQDLPSAIGRVLDDGSTQLTTLTYNAFEKPTQITDPVGRVTAFTYSSDAVDLVTVSQRTAPGVFSNIASFTYNSQHLPLTHTDAAGKTWTYNYNAAGQLTQVTDPLNETTSYIHDGLGRLTQIINPNNRTAASFTYDGFDRIATRTDSEGYTLNFAYDAADRIIKEAYPDGTTRDYTWDKLDLASVKDRLGRTTQYGYDAVQNLTTVTDPLGRQTKFGYYQNGKLKTLTDPNNNVTMWNIDVQSRIRSKIYADGKQFTNTYEATTSRLKSVTDPLGQLKQYAYALDDLVAGLTYLNALNPTPNVNFSYDPYFRRLASMADGSGTTQYQYEPLGALGALRLLKEVGPYQNGTIAYQYDALGRMVGRNVDTSAETFSYDNLGRVNSHGSPLGTFSLNYLGQTGQPTSRVLGGPVRTDWAYDTNTNDRRLKQIKNGAEPRNYDLIATPENLITQLSERGGGAPQTWNYSYDAADRLLQASSRGSQYAYSYDPADNITSVQAPSGNETGTYNNVNQVVAFNGRSFIYDANGNVTDDGVRTYRWDAENRLISVTFKNQLTRKTTFRYDGLGRRIAITSSNGPSPTETRYLWCGSRLCQARNANDVVSKLYYPEGELSSASPLYYAQDQLGSVRDVLSGASGHTAASFDYDPYGSPTRSSGFASTDFRYAQMFYEQNSGLYLTRYRAYNSDAGRWLGRDPVGEAAGANVYAYVRGNPVVYVDLLGLAGLTCFIGGEGTYVEGIGATGSAGVYIHFGTDVPFDFGGYTSGGIQAGSSVSANGTIGVNIGDLYSSFGGSSTNVSGSTFAGGGSLSLNSSGGGGSLNIGPSTPGVNGGTVNTTVYSATPSLYDTFQQIFGPLGDYRNFQDPFSQ